MTNTAELAASPRERKSFSRNLAGERGGCLGTLGHKRAQCLLRFSTAEWPYVHVISTQTILGSVAPGVTNKLNWLTVRITFLCPYQMLQLPIPVLPRHLQASGNQTHRRSVLQQRSQHQKGLLPMANRSGVILSVLEDLNTA